MKKLFLIPLLACFSCVMAWATNIHVSDVPNLKSAIANASYDTIYLDQDMAYTDETVGSQINILRSVVIDGQGHTLKGCAKRTSSGNYNVLSINHNGSQMVDVTIKNITLTGKYDASHKANKPVETRGNIHSLTLIDVIIDNQDGPSGNNQGLTIGGAQGTTANITMTRTQILMNSSSYPVVVFNPINLTMTDSKTLGYCSLYFKPDTYGGNNSTVTATNCDLDAPNPHSYAGGYNSFGLFVMQSGINGVNITLNNCGMNAQVTGNSAQGMFVSQGNNNLTINGDNSHINGEFVISNQYKPTWLKYAAGHITITGGTYAQDPSNIGTVQCYTFDEYDNIVVDGDNNPVLVPCEVNCVPDGYEVQEVKQGEITLYRVVKKVAEKEPGVMYDLNDFVPVEGEGYGDNPVSSFDLSTGTDMTLNNEVTKAGYVQISDNATEGATTVVINKTASDEEQTLVINNGLDVQGDSKVEVKPGASLIIGEGGINTEKPENIVLEVTEDAGAAILLDPTITINKNPNLTVKLTTNSKQLTASPWTYVYQRFAIPVQVGIVPTNDFDGELFPGNTSFKNYVFEWNGYDWVTCSSWGALEPFKGYQLANNSKEGGVTYTFTGQLVGNDNSVYNFPTGGFDFFGNSHLAPIYIDSLLKPYESQAVEASVWLYNYESKNFEAITSEDIADGWAFATEIKPMEGFILNYHGASGSAGMNYASAIWGNPKFDAAIGRPSQSNPAPARNRVSETSNRAIINVVAENGQGDNVKLVEKEKYSAEFENGADASKFVYDNAVSIYASTENGELSRVATNDLTGTLLSFNSNDATNYTITLSNVLGEDYALRDNVTGQTIAFAEGATYTFTQAANTTVPARFEVVSAAKMPTALDNVEEAAKVSGIYTITGQYLGRDFTNLPAGVYIVNGVKIVK